MTCSIPIKFQLSFTDKKKIKKIKRNIYKLKYLILKCQYYPCHVIGEARRGELNRPFDQLYSWYWKYEYHENYSVKNVYTVLQEHKGNTDLNDSIDFWNKIWILKIPPNVCNL